MTMTGNNEFKFNAATMCEIVRHYLVTKMLDPEQVVEVTEVRHESVGYGKPWFLVTVKCGVPAEEKKKKKP